MIKGILFDKDGTLFDFNATWGVWTRMMIEAELPGDAATQAALAGAMGFDLQTDTFLQSSPVIAGTAHQVATIIQPFVGDADHGALRRRMNALAAQAPQGEVTPLRAFFTGLRQRGLKLGVATNDAEASAKHHLATAGITDQLDFIAGYDSGHGGKPEPGQLHAFCTATGLSVDACAMVGDSLHDLHAGRAAGMTTIGVLTGPATASELAPAADVILDTIADIDRWLDN